MPKISILYLLLFISTISWSAEYRRNINWIQGSEKSRFNENKFPEFQGSLFLEAGGLPHYFESFRLNASDAEVIISNPVFESVQDSGFNSVIIPENDLQFKTEIGSSAGQNYLRLTILPFVKRDGSIEKLISFSFSIVENQNRLKAATADYSWKSTSVLSSGKWVKIKTKAKGIFKITYDQLSQWGFQNPDQVAMYGNGGLMLPELNRDLKFDDLQPYPVMKGKDNAGKDCVFFYSTGNIQISADPTSGLYSHQQNYYSTETYFYLTDSKSVLTINKLVELSGNSENTIISFPNYTLYEKEAVNLLSSGSTWFGEKFFSGASQTVSLSLDNPDPAVQGQFAVSLAGKSSSTSTMNVSINGVSTKSISINPTSNSSTSDFANIQVSKFPATLSSKSIQVRLTYSATNSSAEAWLDYVALNYRSFLEMNSDVFIFRGKGADDEASISEFNLAGATAATKIIDVTDVFNVSEVPTVFASGVLKFKSNSTDIREYVAYNPSGNIQSPEFVKDVETQNLHAAELSEMIIVSHPALLEPSEKLAEMHLTNDQMSVQVVTPEVIYNEFSGGLPDPSGIRNYIRMCYDKGRQSGKNTLKYVLLMGDGSYDNRNLLGKNHNLIPTYQSRNSISPVYSIVTDDFFVFLDENEGGTSGTVDLGIGRIPAPTSEVALDVVNKIENYHSKEAIGNWRNVVTFLADDGNIADRFTNTHAISAEALANYVNKNHPEFNTEKIYFDSYRKITSAAGEKFPDVTVAINNRVKQGTLVMNYTGHANERNLADENVLEIGTINSWTNNNRLPIFVTATCEYSRYDADETTAGESILFNPYGGGIGLFSTTRLVFSNDNDVLNRSFFNFIFEKDENGDNLRLGDVMRMAKAAANTDTNQLNFSLLADPAMRLAKPEFQVKTTMMDGKDVSLTADTIKTLSVVTVKGIIADANGEKVSSFNGEIIPTVYDKAMQVETLGNVGQTTMFYNVQNNVIYKGLASVINGEFEFSFFVPKDISFKLDKGKILYYAYNESIDAQGAFSNFYIGGSSDATISDSNGPELDVFLNSNSFIDGGTVSASSVLLADITDATGINTSGTGIGHDITAILDNDNSNIFVLNDYFQADKDSYNSGKIVFPLTDLAEGEHILKLKVWDVLNNSSEIEIRFVVKDDFRIDKVSCFPNPMKTQTTFVFTHNQPDESFDVDLEIFDISGARIEFIRDRVASFGTESQPIEWVPAQSNILMRPGVYIYRITATTNGKTTSGSGRLVFVRQ